MASDKLYIGGFYNESERGWLGGIFCLWLVIIFLMGAFMVNTKEGHGSLYFASDNTVETSIMSV